MNKITSKEIAQHLLTIEAVELRPDQPLLGRVGLNPLYTVIIVKLLVSQL